MAYSKLICIIPVYNDIVTVLNAANLHLREA